MENLAKAILAVMKDVKGIDKDLTVGTGSSSYKGVGDQQVKKVIGDSMQRNGLCILPIEVNPSTKIERWEEETFYQGKSNGIKTKQSVFTEATTKYLLLHESGESQIISGYGQGVDTQDKGAGKATTYALKYTLLYLFLVPTGKIDDSDNEHSDIKDVPKITPKATPKAKPELIPGSESWMAAVKFLSGEGSIDKIETKYSISNYNRAQLLSSAI